MDKEPSVQFPVSRRNSWLDDGWTLETVKLFESEVHILAGGFCQNTLYQNGLRSARQSHINW